MKLKAYIDAGHMTQTKLAEILDVTPGMVWQWLNGHRKVDPKHAIPIEKATGGLVTRSEVRPDIYPKEAA